ncbi:MAG: hypothetical protein WBF52_11615 [Geitlerinemataceae cyanobacterium]
MAGAFLRLKVSICGAKAKGFLALLDNVLAGDFTAFGAGESALAQHIDAELTNLVCEPAIALFHQGSQ